MRKSHNLQNLIPPIFSPTFPDKCVKRRFLLTPQHIKLNFSFPKKSCLSCKPHFEPLNETSLSCITPPNRFHKSPIIQFCNLSPAACRQLRTTNTSTHCRLVMLPANAIFMPMDWRAWILSSECFLKSLCTNNSCPLTFVPAPLINTRS